MEDESESMNESASASAVLIAVAALLQNRAGDDAFWRIFETVTEELLGPMDSSEDTYTRRYADLVRQHLDEMQSAARDGSRPAPDLS